MGNFKLKLRVPASERPHIIIIIATYRVLGPAYSDGTSLLLKQPDLIIIDCLDLKRAPPASAVALLRRSDINF